MTPLKTPFKFGLYRHFKGGVYFAMNLVETELGEVCVQYCNALLPSKWYTRPLSEWADDITARSDNLTGQIYRFERITSFDPHVRDLTTAQLLRELAVREDSPLYGSDIPALASGLTATDYVVGELCEETEKAPKGVYTLAVYPDKDTAFKSKMYQGNQRASVYKRTFILQYEDG